MPCSGRSLLRNTNGAVAPTVALTLIALVAAGGVAFDYARLATMDTELQQAADQAALAAATQLDGKPGAANRAVLTAQSLLQNRTYFASDGGAQVVQTGTSTTDANGTTRLRVTFYNTKAQAEADSNGFAVTAVNADTLAKFVKVEVVGREARYALTPIVGAFRSGIIEAAATAGLGSAICKVPPLMMCNPQEGNGNLGFDVNAYKGIGIRLVEGGSGAAWAPGNFGYLQTGLGPGASVLEYALGANAPPGNCMAVDGVTTKPGENTSVTDAINTRFDIYENGLTNACTSGTCSPSPNVRKDVIRPAGSTNYGFKTGNDPWDLAGSPGRQYLPVDTGAYPSPFPTSMGHPRDTCHAVSEDGTCSAGRIGNGTWDRDLYFYVNYGPPRGTSKLYTTVDPDVPDASWKTIPSLVTYGQANGYITGSTNTLGNITRFDVYKWETQADVLDPYMSHTVTQGSNTSTYTNYGRPQSSAGLPAGPTQLDRRLTSLAVVNCIQQAVQGQVKNVSVVKWVELFLVEPSLARPRTNAGDIYVEVVRETTAGGAAPTLAQVVRRDLPYLVR